MFPAHLLKQDWNKELPRYWNDHSAFKTHFLNALSIVLPECEKFFIGVVKPYLKTTDGEMHDDILEFIKQEGYHRYAHIHYNEWLSQQGLPVKRLQKTTGARWRWAEKILTHKQKLALTICIEHITVVYAAILLEDRATLEAMHPHFRQLWRLHALEELDHKAVTMDVWRSAYTSDALIKSTMLLALPLYMWYVGKHTLVFLFADHQLLRAATWSGMCSFLFNRRTGLIRRSFALWLDLFKPGFHPNDHDHSELLKIDKTTVDLI